MLRVILCLLLCTQSYYAYESLAEIDIPFMYAISAKNIPPQYLALQSPLVINIAVIDTATRLAADMLNNNTCDFPNILPNTRINIQTYENYLQSTIAIQQMIGLGEQNVSFTMGFIAPETAKPSGIVGAVYDIAQLSFFATDSDLSNKRTYPYFSRTSLTTSDHVDTIQDALSYYYEKNGAGWLDVAILAEVSGYSIDYANIFLQQGQLREPTINVIQYRTMLHLEPFELELDEIANSGARVIYCLVTSERYREVLEYANELGIIGENYVWIIPSATTEFSFNGTLPLARGTLVSIDYHPEETRFSACFTEAWKTADPILYPFAGDGNPPPETTLAPWDMVMVAATTADRLDHMELLDGQYIHPQVWSDVLRSVEFEGLTGHISFKSNGDRIGSTGLYFYDPDISAYTLAATRVPGEELSFVSDVVWFSNTTEIPDLDIRPPFHYWSCEDGEEGYDKTGKTVVIQTPDGSNVDEIDIDYHCDRFIDCKNFSDETSDCSSNYTVLFIVFGIITGLLMLVVVLLMIFVLVFGVFLEYKRLRAASPYFLLLLLASIFIGYASIFAWFGKPHPVACGFQPWLLGLPTISMIAVLSVKNFRIWRIFRYPLKRTTVTDFELLILWVAIMIPGLFIIVLWTIVSTPTADMEERNGEDHYVCTTGGFTGSPGGLVFFFIFVAYAAIVLLVGAVISILARKVPSAYNESKLLTISIYNLGFLSVVIIPVFLSLNPINPFLAWILRTCAILYAFTATMVLQFAPRVFGVLIVDKGKNVVSVAMISGDSGNSWGDRRGSTTSITGSRRSSASGPSI